MAIISLAPAGTIGIVKDLPPAELTPEAWSDGRNIRFKDGGLGPFKDSRDIGISFPTQPIWTLPAHRTASGFASWLFMGTNKAYAYSIGSVVDITRAVGDYTGSTYNRWSGGHLGGCTVVNNGVDVPQVWMSPDTAVKLQDLPNWPSGIRAKVLRAHKQFLVALNVTKSGIKYRNMVKWSHPADPGNVPVSWDETDPTKDCGEHTLSETPGEVVDCVSLRDLNIIYKEDSVWGMQFISGTFIFRFYPIFLDFGMPRPDCAVEFGQGMHFVFTGSDLKVHDGQSAYSVVGGRMRKLLSGLSEAQLKSAFVVRNTPENEVWFCWRQRTDTTVAADIAMVYNWVDKTLTLKDLPDYRFIASGPIDLPGTGVNSWMTAHKAWADNHEPWGVATVVPAMARLIGVGAGKVDWVDSQVASTQPGFIERVNLGVVMRAGRPPDMSTTKLLTRVWPRVSGKAGEVLIITLGGSDEVNKAPIWEAPQRFVLGTDTFVDGVISAKLFAVRIESTSGSPWVFSGADADIIPVGL